MTARGGDRRRSREFALQVLFQLDLAPADPETALDEFWNSREVSDQVKAFSERLVLGTMEHRDAIDGILSESATNWRVTRMAAVDRNILRMAIEELLWCPDTPPIVVIDEAIEIAKRFGNDESGPFVNGILDAIRLRIESGSLRPRGETPEAS
jgi:N utilization substance protein B